MHSCYENNFFKFKILKLSPTSILFKNIDQSRKLCHIYTKESSWTHSTSPKPHRSISNNFRQILSLIFTKIVFERNQILNGCQIWSIAAYIYDSLMVRTYIFETRIPISPWRRSLSLSLSLFSRIYSPTPRLIALWDMYDLSPRSVRRIFTSMGR